MPEFLVFTLAAPYASFGAVAVGERRPTWDRPSKSQVLGLIASALGLERSEETRQMELVRAYLFAVRVDDAGRVQSDYHTTQVPPQRHNRRFATRADELAVDKSELKTILSRRENRMGSYYTIALCLVDIARPAPNLPAIAAALRTPQFAPFAGRKANVLSLPMAPHVVTTNDVVAAFTAYDTKETDEQRALRHKFWIAPHPDAKSRIYVDTELVPLSRHVDRVEQRRDIPDSRQKWRFTVRSEALLRSAGGTS